MSSLSEPFLKHYIHISCPSQNDENVTLKVEKELRFNSNVCSFLLFGPPHNKIVSCSRRDDETIRIWSTETYECLKVVEKHSDFVNDFIKLTDEVFLSGSSDGTIRSFNISTYHQEKKFKMFGCGYFYRLLRLSDDLFVVQMSFDELSIWSYEKERHLKIYERVGPLNWNVFQPLFLSHNYSNSFYAATMDKDETIKLVNYEQDEVVKEFKSHNKNRRIYCLFFNSKNEEILIAPHTPSTIYTYNTSRPQFDTRIKISEIVKWDKYKQYRDPPDCLSCCICINNQYLVSGDQAGFSHLYEFEEAEKSEKRFSRIGSIKKVKRKRAHRGSINDLLFVPDRQIILTCSDDKRMKVKVEGLTLLKRTNYDVLDRKDRVEFLLGSMIENSEFFFKVLILQFGDPIEIIVPRSFLT